MAYVITYRDEDGRHFWMGGNCWSSQKADAIVLLTPGYAVKRALHMDAAMTNLDPRSRVSAATYDKLVVVTSLRHEEIYGWRAQG